MIAVKKTGEGYYLVSLTDHKEVLRRIECQMLRREVTEILKPHREISINLKGVKSIDDVGYNTLHELKKIAERIKSKIRYINVEPGLKTKISGLTEPQVHIYNEIAFH